jgi:hypothetical protein
MGDRIIYTHLINLSSMPLLIAASLLISCRTDPALPSDTQANIRNACEPVETTTQCVRMVSNNQSTTQDGKSWQSAFGSIQDAIHSAQEEVRTNGDVNSCDIWVSGGIYYIFSKSRSDTLQMVPGVHLYGGFT